MKRGEEMLLFKPVTLKEKSSIEGILKRAGTLSCQYTFAGLYCLSGKYGTEVAVEGDQLFIRQTRSPYPGQVYFPPVFPGLGQMEPDERRTRLARGFHRLVDRSGGTLRGGWTSGPAGLPCIFGITEEFAEDVRLCLPEGYRIYEQRDWYEYLYETERMRLLPGSGLSAKRRDIRAYWRAFGGTGLEPIGAGNLEEVLDFQLRWQSEHVGRTEDAVQLKAEHEAILTGLSHYEALGLHGLLMRVNGRIAAYGYGTYIGPDVFDVIAQKADYVNYHNIGKVWFHELAKDLKGCRYMNYEEDIGLTGLRQVKLSYKPDILLKKFIAMPAVMNEPDGKE